MWHIIYTCQGEVETLSNGFANKTAAIQRAVESWDAPQENHRQLFRNALETTGKYQDGDIIITVKQSQSI